MSRRSRIESAQSGVTLVELLVALVILGLLMTLVSQAVHQVALIARASQRATEDLHGRWAAGWSASALMANLAAPVVQGSGPAFAGSPDRLRGYSTLTLTGPEQGVTAFELSLSSLASATTGRPAASALMSRTPEEPGMFASRASSDAAAIVAQFSEPAEFAYVNQAGQVLPSWPAGPATAIDAEVLPRAVVVRSIGSGQILMWYAFQGETAPQRPPSKPFWETQG